MIGKIISGLLLAAGAGLAGFWVLTHPVIEDETAIAGLQPDLVRGEYVFRASGCASCHAAKEAQGEARLILSGGRTFTTRFGTFYAPNISSDPEEGIGAWRAIDLVNALHHGVDRDGKHLFPAFPYTTYARMTLTDAVSLHAYLATLPADATPSQNHDLAFPFNMRRGLGLWKRLYLNPDWVTSEVPEEADTGRYIVEALGHCGECHTPRSVFGGPITDAWLSGAANPDGPGRIPDITPGRLNWPEDDLLAYLQSGFTPSFDVAGGSMAEVISTLGTLPEEDLWSVVVYLKLIEP